MNESYLYICSALLCVGAGVCAFVICAASLVANGGRSDQAQGEPSQGGEAGERSDLYP